MKDILFSPLALRNITLPNRFIRSATYEGWGDADGAPRPELGSLYAALARGGAGTLITGFAYISPIGRAMQPCQCGIDRDGVIPAWQEAISRTRKAAPGVKVFMQLAHAGRQTLEGATGGPVVGASSRRCAYFRQQVNALDDKGVCHAVLEFADAAARAKAAGFDGVQVHAAHGYLVHQFLSPWTNTRKDRWANPTLFLEEVIRSIRAECGHRFPILVKLSAMDDTTPGLRLDHTIRTVKRLEQLEVDAVEISYGTMGHALNIIRGDVPVDTALEVNPLFNRTPRWLRKVWKTLFLGGYVRRLIPFSENYNVGAAAAIKQVANLPVIPVGGIRSVEGMLTCLTSHRLDAVSLCRPLICEPDLPVKISEGVSERSKCTNCNLCTIFSDTRQPLRCYHGRPLC